MINTSYSIQEIARLINGQAQLNDPTVAIRHLLTDSRNLTYPSDTLFFALETANRDGHHYIAELYQQGCRNFVVEQHKKLPEGLNNSNIITVGNTLQALQELAAAHRKNFQYPVIGITGSNGKTIVKEWLNQLLGPDKTIVRSPRSYNSQTGVPLSVWNMTAEDELGIFEAGISQPGEMAKLEKIIQPTIGILTNIGAAHDEGFTSREEKTREKLQLFAHCPIVFLSRDNDAVFQIARQMVPGELFTWGKHPEADLHITGIETQTGTSILTAQYTGKKMQVQIPFTDEASIQNALICWSVLLYLEIPEETIAQRMRTLHPLHMRLQMIPAINGSTLINDSYSFDVNSLGIALSFLQQQKISKTVIISDLAYYNLDNYKAIAELLLQKKIDRIIAIGAEWYRHQDLLAGKNSRTEFYTSLEDFRQHFNAIHFQKEAILLKGARRFKFENLVGLLEEKVHQTRLEINLSALAHNLKNYRQYIKSGTKLMAMVKASGYGSGSVEVSTLGQYYHVDYLTVAYADEGVALRNAGISIPIVIMNVDEAAFEALIAHHLEPNIFSFKIYAAFDKYLKEQGLTQYPIHFKIDTGMHRLGFQEADLPEITENLRHSNTMLVKSAFTHFVASEDPKEDDFTRHQAMLFTRLCDYVEKRLGYGFIRHIANSAAILRFPEYQMDMVRLGIGLYGIDSTGMHQKELENVSTLITTIAQLHRVKAGDTVGYNRRGKITRDSVIATIRIGYADGFNRRLGYGNGKVYINGHLAPVVGTICMDMAMVDVTDIPDVQEGDSVEIFGPHIPVQQLADWIGTIPYEILTSIGSRIKRVYVEE